MNSPNFKFLFLLTLGLLMGCAKKEPVGLSLAEIPGAVTAAFEKADSSLKMQAELVVGSVQAKQFTSAMAAVTELTGFPKLTTEQRSVLSRAQITIGAHLRELAGDALPDAPVVKARAKNNSGPAPATPAEEAAAPSPEQAATAAAALRMYQRTK